MTAKTQNASFRKHQNHKSPKKRLRHDAQAAPPSDLKERFDWRIAIMEAPSVSAPVKLVALAIETFVSNRTGEAWPKQRTIAKRAGISIRQVREHLKTLCKLGWVGVLSGSDRTDAVTKNGLHYRLQGLDDRQAADEQSREQPAEIAPSKSGGIPPVLSDLESGGLARQKRQSGVSKAADQRIKSGGIPQLSYEESSKSLEMGGRRSGPPKRVEINSSESPDALLRARPLTDGMEEAPAGGESRDGRDEEPTYDEDDFQPGDEDLDFPAFEFERKETDSFTAEGNEKSVQASDQENGKQVLTKHDDVERVDANLIARESRAMTKEHDGTDEDDSAEQAAIARQLAEADEEQEDDDYLARLIATEEAMRRTGAHLSEDAQTWIASRNAEPANDDELASSAS